MNETLQSTSWQVYPAFPRPLYIAFWMKEAKTREQLQLRYYAMALELHWVSSLAHRSLMPWSRKLSKQQNDPQPTGWGSVYRCILAHMRRYIIFIQ